MSIYAIILICLYAISLLISANQHGKEKTGKYNFWNAFIAQLLVFILLILGDFFK